MWFQKGLLYVCYADEDDPLINDIIDTRLSEKDLHYDVEVDENFLYVMYKIGSYPELNFQLNYSSYETSLDIQEKYELFRPKKLV